MDVYSLTNEELKQQISAQKKNIKMMENFQKWFEEHPNDTHSNLSETFATAIQQGFQESIQESQQLIEICKSELECRKNVWHSQISC